MSSFVSDRLRGQVQVELAQLSQLFAVYRDLLVRCGDHEPSRIELSALGMMLHSFYMGVENIFKRIAAEVDGGPPKGDNWHRDLLASMAKVSPKRRPVISAELQEALKDYLGFRHVFRNAYSFDLEWTEMAPLVLASRTTLDMLAVEINRFLSEPDAKAREEVAE